jgi:tetratricopeptide (TPR) repeat protein
MKKKGFGKSQPSIKEAKKFILAFQKCLMDSNRDEEEILLFFKRNLKKLDESLLEALPLVFDNLISNQLLDDRRNIAETFVILGAFLGRFPLGDRALNLELSIVSFTTALKFFTHKLFPENWANIQNNLAESYRQRILENRAENLEFAIFCCQEALKIRTVEDFPDYWAGVQNNLGNAYFERIKGDIAENLEIAIACFQKSLKVYTFVAFPKDWAMSQTNLGVAYSVRIRGDRAENIESAIVCFHEALKVGSLGILSHDWAITQNNLANAYLERIRGDRAENIESAIACCHEVLKVWTIGDFPQDWAGVQNNLGNAYAHRIRGERAENLEIAIACYREVLKIWTIGDFSQNWARVQNNLGNAYTNRIRGERAENLETAIFYYQASLKVRTFDAFPQDWVSTQNNLGTAYLERVWGERAENLDAAIAYYQQALKVRTVEDLPQDWAITQGNLAEALMERALLINNPIELDNSISLFRQALTVAVPGSSYFIGSQYCLGNALSHRYETSKNPDDLQQALNAYQIALDALSPEHYDRHKYWQALPATQAILGSRLVKDGQWQTGLQLLLNSLNQLKTSSDRLVYANALYQTGYAYEVLTDWENARLYYRDALRLYDHLQNLPGIAKSSEGLGNVLVSQGYLEKGTTELAKAHNIYQKIGKIESAQNVNNIYQAAQQVIDQLTSEALV